MSSLKEASLLLAALGLLALAACADDPSPAQITDDPDAGPDTTAEPDAVAPETTEDAGPEAEAEPEVPPLSTDSGEGVSDGVIVWPEALQGVFIYGLGAEPGTILSRAGNTAAGIIAMPAVVELGDELIIRAINASSLAPVPGEDGVIESYAYEEREDGRVFVDLSAPTRTMELQIYQTCRLISASFELVDVPRYEDGLLTWAAAETFTREGCNHGNGQPSDSTNVHFLRRGDANPGYQPVKPDPTVPFGFFETTSATPYITRLPGVGSGEPDESITYYIGGKIPEQYKPAVREAFEGWNDALEDAIGQRPFVVEDAPPGMLAWDPRYRVVLWDEEESGGAVAPFIEDPFTGELFEAYVILWLGDLDGLVGTYVEFFEMYPELVFDPVGAEEAVRSAMWTLPGFTSPDEALAPDWNDPADLKPSVLRRRVFPERSFGPPEVARYVQSLMLEMTDAEIAEFVVTDFLVHELGHNLGLRHNFLASADRAHKPADISATSTMDYVVGQPAPGTYDVDAMRYAYGSGPHEKGYLYCTDEDVGVDPACQRWDWGSPIGYQLDFQLQKAGDVKMSTQWDDVVKMARDYGWTYSMQVARLLLGSEWESWDPAAPLDTFQWLLDHVICTEDCQIHPWFRAQWAELLLSTRYGVEYGWGPNTQTYYFDYPPLPDEDHAPLFNAMRALVMDEGEPFELRKSIIEVLPGTSLPIAGTLLTALEGDLLSVVEPSSEDLELLALVQEARGTSGN